MKFKNKFVMSTILAAIRHHKFTPVDIEYRAGYFIWYSGDDSVMHFHIKEIKDWKFGVWLSYNNDNAEIPEFCKLEIQFFAQYEPEIDKFKPSDSVFVANYNGAITNQIYKRKSISDFDYFEFINIIKHIKTNPKLAYVQEMNFSQYLSEPFILEYIAHRKAHYKNIVSNYKYTLKRDKLPYLINKISAKLAQKDDIINLIEIKDLNSKYITSYPRYEVHIYFNRVTDNEQGQYGLMTEWVDNTKLFTMKNTSFRFFFEDKELL